MSEDRLAAVQRCVSGSLEGRMTFPEVVGELQAVGVERYHADYCRHENIFYFPAGDSHVVAYVLTEQPIADHFSAEAIEAAIHSIQRGEISYIEFLGRTKQAGCVGYSVHIVGRKAIYFGRRGEVHIEPFPAPKRP